MGNPTILATFTVVASLLPLAFVSGLMGPYMRPIPINASAAMVFSLLVAFVVSPWLTFRLFRRHAERAAAEAHEGHQPYDETAEETRLHRLYARLFRPLLARAWRRWALLGAVAVLLLASMALVYLRLVTVKMLPFDNKSEFQVVVDMPEGSTLEATAGVARRLAAAVVELPEVSDVQVYAGTSAPINFNGLVRHYFLRSGPHVADLQVNLVAKHERHRASHAFARALREMLAPIATATGANVKVAEVPPGPPVLSTLVAEVYGPDLDRRVALAEQVKEIFESTPGVVDVDWLVEAPGPKVDFAVDRDKARRLGITPEIIARTARVALAGAEVGLLHDPAAREPVPIVLRVERAQRASVDGLLSTVVPSPAGRLVPLRELVRPLSTTREKSSTTRTCSRWSTSSARWPAARRGRSTPSSTCATGWGRSPGRAARRSREQFNAMPAGDVGYAMKWDGEWQITYEVFRDMGIAFAVVMVLVYVLVVGWFRTS